jgi:hypothetical protein
VAELETKAAENAVEAAQLETELLANEREAMRQELAQVCRNIAPLSACQPHPHATALHSGRELLTSTLVCRAVRELSPAKQGQ